MQQILLASMHFFKYYYRFDSSAWVKIYFEFDEFPTQITISYVRVEYQIRR